MILDWLKVTHDAERLVGIIDREGNPKQVMVNEEVRDPMTGAVTILNSMMVGKYQVIMEVGPSFASEKLEMVNALQQILPTMPIVAQAAPDLIVKALPFKGAEQIAERIKRMMPENITTDPDSPEAQAKLQQAQAQQQEQQQVAMQLQQQQIQAEQAKSEATIAKAEADVIKAHASVSPQPAPPSQPALPSSAPSQPASAPNTPSQPQPVSQPTHAPVTIQFNAEDALNGIGQQISGMAEQQGQTVAQMLEVIQQVLAATAQSTQLIAASLQGQQQIQVAQAESLQAMASQNAAAMNEVADAIKTQTAVMAAPRVAVRDGKGNIVASEVRV